MFKHVLMVLMFILKVVEGVGSYLRAEYLWQLVPYGKVQCMHVAPLDQSKDIIYVGDGI